MVDGHEMVTMDVERVRQAVAEVEAYAVNDDESAHAAEDAVWRDVLEAIADGAPQPRELAAEALKTWDIEFSRWYA